MNFEKIIEMQKELDNNIEKSSGVKKSDVVSERIVALMVEISEFANENASFKYWKKNKKINRESLVEEFVDGIHFFASLHIDLEVVELIIEPLVRSNDFSKQLLETFQSVVQIKEDYNKEQLLEAWQLYMGCSKILGITDEEIEKHYIKKNKVNYERIANNY